MDSVFHFIFVFFFLLAARVHVKHHKLAPLFFSFVTLLPDMDHFFGLQTRTTFHNVFVTLLVPFFLVALAFLLEKRGVFWKQFAIILLAVLAIHPILDLPGMDSPFAVKYLWPLSGTGFTLEALNQLPFYSIAVEHYLVSPLSVCLLLSFLVMLPVAFLEELTNFMSKNEPFPKAAEEVLEEVREMLDEP